MHETPIQIEPVMDQPRDLYWVIEEEMAQVRQLLAEELAGEEDVLNTLCGYVSRYQGKMLRPALLLLAGKACGPLTRNHIELAVVIELVHLATLIHDDVLDEAELRRRCPTVNQLWGNETSVLLGDLLLSKAFDLCNRVANSEAAAELSQTAKTVCRGELLQCLTRAQWDMPEERYLQIIDMKTASLFQLCGHLGARLAGASTPERQALADYGRFLGRGFQITDDLLDIAGREDETGKTSGTDMVQGKPTLPLIHFCRLADPESRNELIQSFPRQRSGLRALSEQLDRGGSLAYTWQRAREYVARAQDTLQALKATPAREALAGIAEFAVKRSW